jgi:hypothetical protein
VPNRNVSSDSLEIGRRFHALDFTYRDLRENAYS